MDAEPGTPEGDKVEVLITLVEAYEREHYPPALPDPIEAIEFHMERLGLERKHLEPYIGSRGRVSEILNRKRTLSLRMIRNLSAGLDSPLEILVQPYETVDDKTSTNAVATEERDPQLVGEGSGQLAAGSRRGLSWFAPTTSR